MTRLHIGRPLSEKYKLSDANMASCIVLTTNCCFTLKVPNVGPQQAQFLGRLDVTYKEDDYLLSKMPRMILCLPNQVFLLTKTFHDHGFLKLNKPKRQQLLTTPISTSWSINAQKLYYCVLGHLTPRTWTNELKWPLL